MLLAAGVEFAWGENSAASRALKQSLALFDCTVPPRLDNALMPKLPAIVSLMFALAAAHAQVLVDGRVTTPRWPGATETIPLPTVYCIASLDGGAHESSAFRTWETEPPGWFRVSGAAGNYTLLFTQPAHFMRPHILNNVFTRADEKILGLRVTPQFDFCSFSEKEWDTKPATDYFQTFVARGRSVTAIGFKLASDGVDGAGPNKQNLLASVHRRSDGTPDKWPQVGPAVPVLEVDSGGPKNYVWSAGWNSGEVPLTPGETYTVHLCAETPGNGFQGFWRKVEGAAPKCFRIGKDGDAAFQDRQLWMAVSADGDGLVIPYNKRVQKSFGQFGGMAKRWSQTYVAQGRSLAGAVLYAAVSGAQPPLARQRATVRVRHGAPDGPRVGIEKLAIGNGNYTGDASWGVFAVAFAPGEVPLTPGDIYAIEFESIENEETLRGFVNIKKQASDGRAAFNPYRKHVRDDYAAGTSFKNGTEKQDFDLDMQVIEYEFGAAIHSHRVGDDVRSLNLSAGGKLETPYVVSYAARVATNLLRNGSMDDGAFDEDPAPFATKLRNEVLPNGDLAEWKPFAIETAMLAHLSGESKENFARVLGPKRIDGGWSQRVTGLSRFESYELTGRVRSSYPLTFEHRAEIGYDPTGQDTDPKAPTIFWTAHPKVHGVWETFTSEPIRPATNSISVWLRARSTGTEFPFKADFDDLSLHRIRTAPPEVHGVRDE
jgi:hypothetical protein